LTVAVEGIPVALIAWPTMTPLVLETEVIVVLLLAQTPVGVTLTELDDAVVRTIVLPETVEMGRFEMPVPESGIPVWRPVVPVTWLNVAVLLMMAAKPSVRVTLVAVVVIPAEIAGLAEVPGTATPATRGEKVAALKPGTPSD